MYYYHRESGRRVRPGTRLIGWIYPIRLDLPGKARVILEHTYTSINTITQSIDALRIKLRLIA